MKVTDLGNEEKEQKIVKEVEAGEINAGLDSVPIWLERETERERKCLLNYHTTKRKSVVSFEL